MPDLIVKKRWSLGMIDLETHHTEADLLELAWPGGAAPHNWDLSAMAVAIAAAREIEALKTAIDNLTAQVRVLELSRSTKPTPALRAQDIPSGGAWTGLSGLLPRLETDPEIEPDSDELQADYERRLARVERLAVSGIGWSELVRRALGAARRELGQECYPRPTPRELAKIEQWLDQNATRKPGRSL